MSTLTPRGTAWVGLRQHRPALWTVLLVVGLAIGCAIAARVWVGSAGISVSCGKGCLSTTEAAGWFDWAQRYVGGTAILLPLLVAAFTAGPLIARELESGTYRLAWTQSVSPARWLATRLVWTTALAVAGTVLLVVTFRWSWSYPLEGSFLGRSWFGRDVYPALGVTAVAHVLLAVAVGAFAAVLVRRTLPAMAAGLVTTAGIGFGFALVRPYLWPTATSVDRVSVSGDGWVTQRGVVLADGNRMTQEQCWDIGLRKSPCLSQSPDIVPFAEYHPTSHFWPLQLVETGIVLLLAAACVFATFKVLRRIHG